MKVLIAFYSRTGNTAKTAEYIAKQFRAKKHAVKLFKVRPMKELRAYDYHKNEKDLLLKKPLVDLSSYDLVLVGTPVWNFSPTPIITSYLRKLRNVDGKKFGVFVNCTALPGTAIKKMSSILSTKGVLVKETLTVRSIFELDESKLKETRPFVEKLAAQP